MSKSSSSPLLSLSPSSAAPLSLPHATHRRCRPFPATSSGYGQRVAQPHLPLALLLPSLLLDLPLLATSARPQPLPMARVSAPAWLWRLLSAACRLLDGTPRTAWRGGPSPIATSSYGDPTLPFKLRRHRWRQD